MPRAYEKMRDKFAKGAKVDSPAYNEAQSKAAAIYNARHKSNPVQPGLYERARQKAKRR